VKKASELLPFVHPFLEHIIGAPTPPPKAPHEFRLTVRGTGRVIELAPGVSGPEIENVMVCQKCNKRMNEAGEFCKGR
jgi:hypothetical protein